MAESQEPTVRAAQVTLLTISDVPRLDPIRVVCANEAPGKGRIIVQCFDEAWCGYWGAMAGRTVEQFFVDCTPDYLSGCLAPRQRFIGDRQAYVEHIIAVVQDALRARLDAEKAAARMSPDQAVQLLRCPEASLTQRECERIANTLEALQRELQRLQQPSLLPAGGCHA